MKYDLTKILNKHKINIFIVDYDAMALNQYKNKGSTQYNRVTTLIDEYNSLDSSRLEKLEKLNVTIIEDKSNYMAYMYGIGSEPIYDERDLWAGLFSGMFTIAYKTTKISFNHLEYISEDGFRYISIANPFYYVSGLYHPSYKIKYKEAVQLLKDLSNFLMIDAYKQSSDRESIMKIKDSPKIINFIETYIVYMREDEGKDGFNDYSLIYNKETNRFSINAERNDFHLGIKGKPYYFCKYCQRIAQNIKNHAKEHFLNADIISNEEKLEFKIPKTQDDFIDNMIALYTRIPELKKYESDYWDDEIQIKIDNNEYQKIFLEFIINTWELPYDKLIIKLNKNLNDYSIYITDMVTPEETAQDNGVYYILLYILGSKSDNKETIKDNNKYWNRVMEIRKELKRI